MLNERLFAIVNAMSKIRDEILPANQKYAASFGERGKLALPPARGFPNGSAPAPEHTTSPARPARRERRSDQAAADRLRRVPLAGIRAHRFGNQHVVAGRRRPAVRPLHPPLGHVPYPLRHSAGLGIVTPARFVGTAGGMPP